MLPHTDVTGPSLDHSSTEIASPHSSSAAPPTLSAGGALPPQDPRRQQLADILTEIERLLRKKTSWGATALILIISLALFLAIGLQSQAGFLRMLALVPILLFHEFGHYLAMRMCGYRNLRMFFIPGFGAAVTGRHFNVAGWKKVLVSLMGPAPGIILGIIIGLCGMLLKNQWVIDAGVLTVAINGFNLLPLLPLDGGHIVHTVLFSRHVTLDAVFRVVAVLALTALGAWAGDYLFVGLGAFMAMGIPFAFRVARAARDLRRDGGIGESSDGQTVPRHAAECIAAKLISLNPRPLPNKLVAQQTLQVFETLNTRPPRMGASVGLLSVHALLLASAVTFATIFVMARKGAAQDMFRAAAHAPTHALATSDIRSWPEHPDGQSPGLPHITVVATFAKPAPAAEAFEKAKQSLGPQETVTLLGDTVLVRINATDDEARKRWLAELEPDATPDNVFVDGPTMHATFEFQGIAPSDAAAKHALDELIAYFSLPLGEGLIAPWSPIGAITPQQQLARRTYAALQSAGGYDDPSSIALSEQLATAERHGEEAAAKSLLEKYNQNLEDLRDTQLKRLAEDDTGDVDVAVAREYSRLLESEALRDVYSKTAKALAPHLGRAIAEASPGSEPDQTWARSGYASQTAMVIRINGASFADPAEGAKAIIAWLAKNGVRSLRYEVRSVPFEYEQETEDDDLTPD